MLLHSRYFLSAAASAMTLCLALPVFADTLQDIYSLALDNDHQLKADTAAYYAGKEYRTLGRANLLPQIQASGKYSNSDSEITNHLSAGNPTANSDQKQNVWSATLSQPLFNMPAWFSYQQGVSLSEQAEAQFSADQQSLIVRVADAYFNVLRSIENVETSSAEEKALAHQLEQTRQRFEVGLTAITDVHEAQAAFDSATATTLETKGNLGIAFEALEVITGKAHTDVAPLDENFPVIKPEPLARHEWVDFALKNNHHLRTARLAADASRQNSRAKTSAHLPTVTGVAYYSDSDDDGKNLGTAFDTRTESEIYSVQVDIPIFTGGRLSGERRQAHQQRMQTQEMFQKTQRDTVQQARALHLSVMTDVARIAARRQAITSNLSALEATQAGYDAGTRNLVDVLIAQRSLYQARRSYSNALYDYVINMFRLKEVAGTLSPADVTQLNQWLNQAQSVARAKYEG